MRAIHRVQVSVETSRSASLPSLPVIMKRNRVEASVEHFAWIQNRPGHQQPRHEPCPPGLVAGAETGAVVAMEVLIEQDQLAPEGSGLKSRAMSIDSPAAGVVAQKHATKVPGNNSGDFPTSHLAPGPGRAFDSQRIAIVGVHSPEGLDQEHVDRHPYRTAPVGVAAEKAG